MTRIRQGGRSGTKNKNFREDDITEESSREFDLGVAILTGILGEPEINVRF